MAFTDIFFDSTNDSQISTRKWLTASGEVMSSDLSFDHLYGSVAKKYKSEIMSKFFSKFLQCVPFDHRKKEQNISIALFTRPRSDILADIISAGCFLHTTYPVPSDQQDGKVAKLHIYGLSIISDVLEHLPTKMARANVIKEALAVLHTLDNSTCLLIIADPSAFSVKELESLALYAGAKKILYPKCFKEAKLLYVVAI